MRGENAGKGCADRNLGCPPMLSVSSILCAASGCRFEKVDTRAARSADLIFNRLVQVPSGESVEVHGCFSCTARVSLGHSRATLEVSFGSSGQTTLPIWREER